MPSLRVLSRLVPAFLVLLALASLVPASLRGGLFDQGAAGDSSASTGAADYFELPSPPDEETCVKEGIALEKSREWISAIEHYEQSLESFPKNDSLKYGLRRARIQFGIHRRYSDESFEKILLRQSPREALALYDEVYREIRSSYFDPVSLTNFTAHGTESIYLALGNEKFLARHLPNADPARIAEVRGILRDDFWNRNVEDEDQSHQLIGEVSRILESRLGLNQTALIMEYMFGGCNALDEYSNFLTPDHLDDLYGNIDGEFVGLGIEMQAEKGRGMLLIDVLPNSPAAAGGMRPGEYIVAIDGRDCREMSTDEAARLLRGPAGSTIRLTLLASKAIDEDPAPWTGSFVRRPVDVQSIEQVRMLDSDAGIGYLNMSGFQKSTADELDAALKSLRRQGMNKLIWDLRGNPGGLLTAAVSALDRFIAEGVLVSTKGRSLDQNWTYSAHRPETFTEIELVVLIDGQSASASEIVAGAIQDHQRGTLVGRTSFGKWCVQTIMPMEGDLGIRLTTAKFYSPDGHNYGQNGIVPDVVVRDRRLRGGDLDRESGGEGEMPPAAFGFHPDQDADIQAALKVLRGESRELTSR